MREKLERLRKHADAKFLEYQDALNSYVWPFDFDLGDCKPKPQLLLLEVLKADEAVLEMERAIAARGGEDE